MMRQPVVGVVTGTQLAAPSEQHPIPPMIPHVASQLIPHCVLGTQISQQPPQLPLPPTCSPINNLPDYTPPPDYNHACQPYDGCGMMQDHMQSQPLFDMTNMPNNMPCPSWHQMNDGRMSLQ